MTDTKGNTDMSEAKSAYEEDVRRRPTYHDGKPRRAWEELSIGSRWLWRVKLTPQPEPSPDTAQAGRT